MEETVTAPKNIIQKQEEYIVKPGGKKSGGNLFFCKLEPDACVGDFPTVYANFHCWSIELHDESVPQHF